MILLEDKNFRIQISDIETLAGFIDLGFYNPDTEEWNEFQISKYQNDLYDFIKFYNKQDWDYIVGYNYIAFDAQVIQYILEEYTKWYDLENQEIIDRIYRFSQELISSQDFKQFLPYKVERFEIPVIDVFTLLGLDNIARRSSLKKIQFQLNMDSVEEMPIHHSIKDISRKDIKMITNYRRNDVLSTYIIFKLCMGDTAHLLYKDNNQLELRFSIMEEFGLNCLSYSDIKIGDELLKESYANAIKKSIRDIPTKGFFRKEIKLNKCIPKYIEFKSEQLKKLHQDLLKTTVKQIDSHEIIFRFGKLNTEYTIGLGGGHSTNKAEIYFANDEYELIDLDVSSLYPAIICNENYYPYHLGKEFLNVYKKLYERRLELKPQSKTDKKIKGICDAIKLILNSAYGKMGSLDSWMYDKQVPYSVCLTGQLVLFMLIEELELIGIPCFSMNTDGATFKVKKILLPEFYNTWNIWEQKTGLFLEETKFKSIRYAGVNSYIAEGYDGITKKKDEFITSTELWKNSSNRIIALAYEQYFIHGINPIEFITNHQNIFDFCIMARANGKLHIEEQWTDTDNKIHIKTHKKLVRYYISNTNRILFRRGTNSKDKPANSHYNAPNEIDQQYIQYFNQYTSCNDFSCYKVDYRHYILKCLRMIDKIENTKRVQSYINSLKSDKQLQLF